MVRPCKSSFSRRLSLLYGKYPGAVSGGAGIPSDPYAVGVRRNRRIFRKLYELLPPRAPADTDAPFRHERGGAGAFKRQRRGHPHGHKIYLPQLPKAADLKGGVGPGRPEPYLFQQKIQTGHRHGLQGIFKLRALKARPHRPADYQ